MLLWERESQCAFVPYFNTHYLEYAIFLDLWNFNIKHDNFASFRAVVLNLPNVAIL